MATKTVERPVAARTPRPRKTATPGRPGRRQAASTVAEPARGRPVGHAALAAERALRRTTVNLRLPIVGELRLPSSDALVFIGGVGVLAVVGLLEWPVAVLLGVGHALATSQSGKVVHAFGEALEEA
jgi:hypothetical protein